MRRNPTRLFQFCLIDVLLSVAVKMILEKIVKVLWGRVKKMRLRRKRRNQTQAGHMFFRFLTRFLGIPDIPKEEIITMTQKTNTFFSGFKLMKYIFISVLQ